MVDRVVLRPAPGAEPRRRETDRQRVELGDDAALVREHRVLDRRELERSVRIAALRARSTRRHSLQRSAGGDGLARAQAAFVLGRCPRSLSDEQHAGGREDELAQVRRAARRGAARRTSRISSALPTARPSGRRHVGDAAPAPRVRRRARSRSSRRRARARARCRFMNAPEPTLTSSTIASAPPASFLRHDRRGDQRDALDGPGDVAQRVQRLVGRARCRRSARRWRRRSTRTCSTNRACDSSTVKPGIDFELVERAAGVAEAAAAHLAERHAARGDDRCEREADLVAHAAGGVLVDDAPARARRRVEHVAGARPSPASGAASRRCVEPAEADRHQQRAHLVVGDRSADVARR